MKKEMRGTSGIIVATLAVLALCFAGYSCASSPKDKATKTAAPATAAAEPAAAPAANAAADTAAKPVEANAAAKPEAVTAAVPGAAATAPASGAQAQSAAEAQSANNDSIATPTKQYVLDWSNRNLGEAYNPQWLKDLVMGKTQSIREDYNLGCIDDTIIRYSVGTSPATSSGSYIGGKNNAMTIADSNYSAELANELKRVVLSQTGGFLNGTEFKTLNNAVSAAKVTLVGQQRVIDFWQLVETRNSMTGERTREYIYYIVYATSKTNWNAMVDMYLKQVLGYIPAERRAQVEAAAKAASGQENIKSQDDLLNQLQGQVNALKSDMSNNAQQEAYASGDASKAADASVTPDDYDWINAMIQSSQLLFQ
jgi:hypothetical protein